MKNKMSFYPKAKECKKCGEVNHRKKYHKYIQECDYKGINMSDKEHLHFQCLVCGYDWIEKTLDNNDCHFHTNMKMTTKRCV